MAAILQRMYYTILKLRHHLLYGMVHSYAKYDEDIFFCADL